MAMELGVRASRVWRGLGMEEGGVEGEVLAGLEVVAEVGLGTATAGGGGVFRRVVDDAENGVGHGVDVAFVDDDTGVGVDGFGAATGAVGDDGCAAGEGFKVHGGEVVGVGGIGQDGGGIVELDKFADVLGLGYAVYALGE